jgi:hypothetical protein
VVDGRGETVYCVFEADETGTWEAADALALMTAGGWAGATSVGEGSREFWLRGANGGNGSPDAGDSAQKSKRRGCASAS